jgi:hypothetical protein
VQIPIDEPKGMLEKEEARDRLGLPRDAVIAVTVASEQKFFRFGDIDFARHHATLAARHRQVIHVVIGPSADDRWQAAKERAHGRLHAIGPRRNASPFLDAADFYVDSYPIASVTSYLEAAARGRPVISLDPWGGLGTPIHAPERFMQPGVHKFLNPAEYDAAYGQMVADAEYRTQVGESDRAAIAALYGMHSFRKSLTDAEEVSAEVAALPASTRRLAEPLTKLDVIDYVLVALSCARVKTAEGLALVACSLPWSEKLWYRQHQPVAGFGWLPEEIACLLNSWRDQWAERRR